LIDIDKIDIIHKDPIKKLIPVPFVINKRARRVLGRSPEEKVKCHSGANKREHQGHNFNNFGKGPFDDVIY